jgi:hypothetical protein
LSSWIDEKWPQSNENGPTVSILDTFVPFLPLAFGSCEDGVSVLGELIALT